MRDAEAVGDGAGVADILPAQQLPARPTAAP
jgi:hypothetical protein